MCLNRTRDYFAKRFADRDTFLSFASADAVNSLAKQTGIRVENLSDIIGVLPKLGYHDVACLSLYLNDGEEYKKAIGQISLYDFLFNSVTITEPLFSDGEDVKKCLDILMRAQPQDGREVLFVRHKVEIDKENDIVKQAVSDIKGAHIIDFGASEREIKSLHLKSPVQIIPLTVTFGNHARRGIAEGEDSVAATLWRNGVESRYSESGLCDYDEILELFFDKLCRAFKDREE